MKFNYVNAQPLFFVLYLSEKLKLERLADNKNELYSIMFPPILHIYKCVWLTIYFLYFYPGFIFQFFIYYQ
jgi:hypothetical protein